MTIAEQILKNADGRYAATEAAARKGGKDVLYTDGMRVIVMPDDSAIELRVGPFAANIMRARNATVAELGIAIQLNLPTPTEGNEVYFWGGQSVRYQGGLWYVVA